MVSDELIGISGVFVFTFCLIALYHFIGVFGRHKKARGVSFRQIQIKEARQHRPLSHGLNRSLGKDDAWLMWNPELDAHNGPPNPGFGGRRSEGR